MDISDQIVELLLSQLKILLVECDTRSFAAKWKKVGFKEHYIGHNNKGKMILYEIVSYKLKLFAFGCLV